MKMLVMIGLIAFHNSISKKDLKKLSGERYDVLTIDVLKLFNSARKILYRG